MNVERLVKRFRLATDADARHRILSDAIEVLAESHRTQEVPAVVTSNGMIPSSGFLQRLDPIRLAKLAGLGIAIAFGYVGMQYIIYVCYLQFAFR